MKGSNGRKVNWFSSVVSRFLRGDKCNKVKSSRKPAVPRGPEASMVAAAKHFSSAHKVRLV
ncbi:hypothetical protein DCAR_0832937 [Daucus carota subsp. sativus]|uniref:Uncharacterized protein n=1 Tax=Daucus carota subsp. sativus TaxID=79200 RepID=A0AAF0XU51_DAUCS|nr:hypothetical protein DCAR_0832937 [Daucus carota subsp. sativus]